MLNYFYGYYIALHVVVYSFRCTFQDVLHLRSRSINLGVFASMMETHFTDTCIRPILHFWVNFMRFYNWKFKIQSFEVADDVPTLTFITSRVAMWFSADKTGQNVHKQGGQVTDCMTFCCIPDSYYLRFYTLTYQNLTLPRGVWIGKRVERP